MEDVSDANINVVGDCDWRVQVLGELNESAIPTEEVKEAVNEMKSVWLRGWMIFQWSV